ncbi:MAG: type II toxin-antitoxin system death-on-curing family toxin [Phycisphaerales bacterium]|jgi:death on curing protein|nr:type II toxin-antitoxin system death-on-curing family toxin [Phycisphaerales bacterium]MBT7171678.1 type II toxin-antitoxin system death-on-curing family toxin [Phycisphaerales bacterium]
MKIDFLDLGDVLEIHTNQLDLYGGSAGIRDNGLLESAIAQPQGGFGKTYLHGNLFEMAAAYLYHLVQNHPFLDGNKRVGTAAALIFLDINGIEINAPKGSVYNLTIAVATGAAKKPEIAEFFRSHAL